MRCLYTRYPVATGGLYSSLGSRPFHIPHFPFSPLIGRLAFSFFSSVFLCCSCDVLEILKQREFGWTCFIDGSHLKQRTQRPAAPAQAVFFFLSPPPASWQRRPFHCQRLLIRSVTVGLYGPVFFLHLAFVYAAIDESFSQL